MKRLTINPVPCTGCLSCESACALAHSGPHAGGTALIRVVLDVFGGRHSHLYCRQCEQAACASACPAGAISRSPDTCALLVSESVCTGCGECIRACPYSAMLPDTAHGAPLKCDLCGGAPVCAEACRFGAIHFLEQDDPAFGEVGMPGSEQDPSLGRSRKGGTP